MIFLHKNKISHSQLELVVVNADIYTKNKLDRGELNNIGDLDESIVHKILVSVKRNGLFRTSRKTTVIDVNIFSRSFSQRHRLPSKIKLIRKILMICGGN